MLAWVGQRDAFCSTVLEIIKVLKRPQRDTPTCKQIQAQP